MWVMCGAFRKGAVGRRADNPSREVKLDKFTQKDLLFREKALPLYFRN